MKIKIIAIVILFLVVHNFCYAEKYEFIGTSTYSNTILNIPKNISYEESLTITIPAYTYVKKLEKRIEVLESKIKTLEGLIITDKGTSTSTTDPAWVEFQNWCKWFISYCDKCDKANSIRKYENNKQSK